MPGRAAWASASSRKRQSSSSRSSRRPTGAPSAIQERPRTPNIRKLSPHAENRKRLSPQQRQVGRRLGRLGLGQDGAHAVEVGIGLADHRRGRRRRHQPPDADGQQERRRPGRGADGARGVGVGHHPPPARCRRSRRAGTTTSPAGPRRPAPPGPRASSPGVISMRVSRAVRGKAPLERGQDHHQRRPGSADLLPVEALEAGRARRPTQQHRHAGRPGRVQPARRPKASITSTRPRIEERKWLISMSTIGVCSTSHMKRSGSDGVAPEASSITPAAATSRAQSVGAPARNAGRRCPNLSTAKPPSPLWGGWTARKRGTGGALGHPLRPFGPPPPSRGRRTPCGELCPCVLVCRKCCNRATNPSIAPNRQGVHGRRNF